METILSNHVLRNHSPLSFFFDLCEIPRASHNEVPALDFLKRFAAQRRLRCRQSANGSLLISKPGQNSVSPPLMLQAHIDMVYVQSSDSAHIYGNPLDIRCEDGVIRANGTSLGADNGIGAAYILAILDSSTLTHPPIHALFTTSEEDGMLGATTLESELLPADRIINLDGEVGRTLTVGSAGTKGTLTTIPFGREAKPLHGSVWDLKIHGLAGGHSGFQIINHSANAIRLLATLLHSVLPKTGAAVISLSGGSKRNAIPSEASARIRIPQRMEAALHQLISDFQNLCQKSWNQTDPNLQISLSSAEDCHAAISSEAIPRLLNAIGQLPDGVLSMHPDLQDTILTSANIGVLCTLEQAFTLECSMRSSVKEELEELVQAIRIISSQCAGTCDLIADCPPWEYTATSPLCDLCSDICLQRYHEHAKQEIIHAALECGCFRRLKPKLDAVSIGPTIFNVHTPQEYVYVSDILDTWEYLCDILANA